MPRQAFAAADRHALGDTTARHASKIGHIGIDEDVSHEVH